MSRDQQILDRMFDQPCQRARSKLCRLDEALDKEPELKQQTLLEPAKRKAPPVSLCPEQVAATHQCLQILAGMCDGARQIDNVGINKMDSRIGKELAHSPSLWLKTSG